MMRFDQREELRYQGKEGLEGEGEEIVVLHAETGDFAFALLLFVSVLYYKSHSRTCIRLGSARSPQTRTSWSWSGTHVSRHPLQHRRPYTIPYILYTYIFKFHITQSISNIYVYVLIVSLS